MQGHRDTLQRLYMGIGTALTAGVLLIVLGWSTGSAGAATTGSPVCVTPTALPTATTNSGTASPSPSPSPSPTPLPPTATPATSGIITPLLSGGQATATATASPTPLPTCTPVPATATIAVTVTTTIPRTASVASLPSASSSVGMGTASAAPAVVVVKQSPIATTSTAPKWPLHRSRYVSQPHRPPSPHLLRSHLRQRLPPRHRTLYRKVTPFR